MEDGNFRGEAVHGKHRPKAATSKLPRQVTSLFLGSNSIPREARAHTQGVGNLNPNITSLIPGAHILDPLTPKKPYI